MPETSSFHDPVLFLKHNMRGQSALSGTVAKIDADVTNLMKSIDASMQEADPLISSLSSADAS